MAFFEIQNVRIAGISAAVPSRTIKTSESEKLSDEYDNEAYAKSTGVYERRYSDTLTVTDLGVEGAEQLLNKLKWDKNEVDALFLVTQTQDYIAPASACILQDRLGLDKECMALDISLGCSGWVYGLSTLSALVAGGNIRKALLIAGDARQWHNFDIDALFGSATTVTALEYREGEVFKFHCGTDGSGWDALYVPHGGSRNPVTLESFKPETIDGKTIYPLQSHMRGMDVFGFGITAAPKSIKKLKAKYEIPDGEIDYYIFHQANKLMIDTIVKKMKLDTSRVPLCLGKFGNTSSASIPLTLVSEFEGGIKENLKLLCCGFGIGLSWGSVYLNLDKDVVIPQIVEVDD